MMNLRVPTWESEAVKTQEYSEVSQVGRMNYVRKNV